MKRLYVIKAYSPYVAGVVGRDIKLSLRERIAILFSGGIAIHLVSDALRYSHVKEGSK